MSGVQVMNNEDNAFRGGLSLGSKDTTNKEDFVANIVNVGDNIGGGREEPTLNVAIVDVEANVNGPAEVPSTSTIPLASDIAYDRRQIIELLIKSIQIDLEGLPIPEMAMELDNGTLAFGLHMADWGMVQRVDNHYYDFHFVKYRCVGVEGQFHYEKVASIFKNVADEDRVSFPVAIDMIDKALDDADAETAQDV